MQRSTKAIVLHLSHTDVRFDSRILKELHAFEEVKGIELRAIGVKNEESFAKSSINIEAPIDNLSLFTKKFKLIPRAIRYVFMLLELIVRMSFRGVTMHPTIVHCHDTLVLPAGRVIKLITRSKLVYDAHELESCKNGQTITLSKATLLLERFCWNRVDLLISVSPSILQWYKDNIGEKSSVLVLNSPQIERLDIAKTKRNYGSKYFHDRYRIPNDRLIFVYLGVLELGRGIDIYLEAFTQAEVKSHVVFIGFGELSSKIANYSKRFDNIHLHSPVPHDQVVGLVRNADVGLCLVENVSLSDYYCLPNKLFEYAFAGLPVLASDFPEIKHIVDQYSLGVCCPPDADSVGATIQRVTQHRPAKIESSLADLSWEAQADRLRCAYANLFESKN